MTRMVRVMRAQGDDLAKRIDEWPALGERSATIAAAVAMPRQRRHVTARCGWDSLTSAERRVTALVAQGLSNPEIATMLGISWRTVQCHVSHILDKLNLKSRIDIAREASKRDLKTSEPIDPR
jgi:DNA-binding NarL/FixJ family response regulator